MHASLIRVAIVYYGLDPTSIPEELVSQTRIISPRVLLV